MKKASASAPTGFDPVRLIQRHQAGVWRYLRVLGCDTTQADDLTQETFLAVLQKPFDDYNTKATAAYLRRVAHNLFISFCRKNRRMKVVDNIEQIDAIWQQWTHHDNGEETLDVLKTCLEGLSKRAKWALDMRFRDRLSRENIAKALEITEHGAKNLMQRAKKQLRGCMEGKLQ